MKLYVWTSKVRLERASVLYGLSTSTYPMYLAFATNKQTKKYNIQQILDDLS